MFKRFLKIVLSFFIILSIVPVDIYANNKNDSSFKLQNYHNSNKRSSQVLMFAKISQFFYHSGGKRQTRLR